MFALARRAEARRRGVIVVACTGAARSAAVRGWGDSQPLSGLTLHRPAPSGAALAEQQDADADANGEGSALTEEERALVKSHSKRSKVNRRRIASVETSYHVDRTLVPPPQVPWLVLSEKTSIVEQAEAQWGPKETWADVQDPEARRELLGILVSYMMEVKRDTHRAQKQSLQFRRYAVERHAFYASWVRSVAEEPRLLHEWDVDALPFLESSQPAAASLGAGAAAHVKLHKLEGTQKERRPRLSAAQRSAADDVEAPSSGRGWDIAGGYEGPPDTTVTGTRGGRGWDRPAGEHQQDGEPQPPKEPETEASKGLEGTGFASVEMGGAPFLRQRVREGRVGDLSEGVLKEMRRRKMATDADAQAAEDKAGGPSQKLAKRVRKMMREDREGAQAEADDAAMASELAEAEAQSKALEKRRAGASRGGMKLVNMKLSKFLRTTRTDFDEEGMFYRITPELTKPKSAKPALRGPDRPAADDVVKVDWKTLRAMRNGPRERRHRARERFIRLVRGERVDTIPPLHD